MENQPPLKSKTEKKKEAEQLQQLGLKLDKLTVWQLEGIDIPENLKTALLEGKTITSNIAGRRHRQFIGALMRNIDPDIIHNALQEADQVDLGASKEQDAAAVRAEILLKGGMADVEALISEYPGFDRQRLRQLVRNARKATPGPKAVKARKVLEQVIRNEII